MNQQQALKKIDEAVRNTRVVTVQPSAVVPVSCCQYHSAALPDGCREGRDCPARQHIQNNPFEKLKVALVLVVILVAFGLVGEMDYQDALAQEAPKTMVAKKEVK